MPRRFATVLLLVALVSGCASEDGHTRGASSIPARQVPQLQPAVSADESLRVLDDYVARYNKAIKENDGRAWRDLLAEPLLAMADAGLRINRGRPPERGSITLVNPVLFVPRLDGYPGWFIAAVMERRGSGKPQQVLLMFTRSDESAGWRLASRTTVREKLPKIATDGQGYAVPVPAETAGGLAMNLADLPPAHAAYLQDGDARGFARGPYTSQWRDGRAAWAKRLRGHGWHDVGTFTQTRYPLIALRTKDGGVLAWYAVSRVESLASAGSSPFEPQTVPSDIRSYLGKPVGNDRTEVRAAWLLLPLSYLPTSGQASVLGLSTGLTSAATIEH